MKLLKNNLKVGARFLAGTGIGLGLLISDRLNEDQRKAAGWALLAVGVLTTIPIVKGVLAKPPVGGKAIRD